jgi:hypothetical protein
MLPFAISPPYSIVSRNVFVFPDWILPSNMPGFAALV